jgi:hypothetical protein
MKSKAEKQLESVRKDLKAFLELLRNTENEAIYVSAHIQGVKLSKEYLEKVTPISKRLSKFAGVK